MKTIICDRCKNIVCVDNQKIDREMIIEAIDPNNSFDRFFGIRRKFDLCKECFEEFWYFTKGEGSKPN